MTVRRIRLVTGLILFFYLTTHFLNHSLGLVSLDAMGAGRAWFVALWRSVIGTVALYTALAMHIALAFYALYRRRHLRMPRWEALQLTLGLTIPLLLTAHLFGTRIAHDFFGVEDSYALIVLTLWAANPAQGVKQTITLIVAWIHGCIGIHFWLRFRPWYTRAIPFFFAYALLIPILGLLGFFEAGREISEMMARDPDWFDRTLREAHVPVGAQRLFLTVLQERALETFLLILAAVLLARVIRDVLQRRNRIRITYPGGLQVALPNGLTVLEASRLFGIPHTSVCGGRGRCSTCRVRVTHGLESLPAAKSAELKVLQRVGAPPNVRLACQLRPTADLSVSPLVAASAAPPPVYRQPSYLAGEEREIVVLFADLRSFTGMAEHKLPYDLVFVLNSYFKVAGEAVTHAGGVVDKFIGDGVMALFGIEAGATEGCRHALAAAQGIVRGVNHLNELLATELAHPLKIGVGIHSGPAVVGRMGYGAAVHLTAIGDTVNVASRLQDLTKEYGCQMIVSEQVAQIAGVKVELFPRRELTVRNRREPLAIYTIDDVRALASDDAVADAS
jgi:adenylate cyclase